MKIFVFIEGLFYLTIRATLKTKSFRVKAVISVFRLQED